jgi:hypothetical protein
VACTRKQGVRGCLCGMISRAGAGPGDAQRGAARGSGRGGLVVGCPGPGWAAWVGFPGKAVLTLSTGVKPVIGRPGFPRYDRMSGSIRITLVMTDSCGCLKCNCVC